jgi:hypothetical protein
MQELLTKQGITFALKDEAFLFWNDLHDFFSRGSVAPVGRFKREGAAEGSLCTLHTNLN